MGVGAGLYMYVVVVQKFTFAISSPDEFLVLTCKPNQTDRQKNKQRQTDRQTDRQACHVTLLAPTNFAK